MKILFFGDSITDMLRNREAEIGALDSYGFGYTSVVASALSRKNPLKYRVINRGISGNRSIDLYDRLKPDVLALKPDVLSILIGVNDVWHEISFGTGVPLDKFVKTYSLIIEKVKKALPDTKIILLEPFFLKGKETAEHLEEFAKVKDYAKEVKALAEKYGLYFVPLQQRLDYLAGKFGDETYLYDGVHPSVAGATVIADEWLKYFENLLKSN